MSTGKMQAQESTARLFWGRSEPGEQSAEGVVSASDSKEEQA